jgi:hypothetical protein
MNDDPKIVLYEYIHVTLCIKLNFLTMFVNTINIDVPMSVNPFIMLLSIFTNKYRQGHEFMLSPNKYMNFKSFKLTTKW